MLVSCFHLVAGLGHEPAAILGLRARALSDQEEKVVVDQRVQEKAAQLVTLTISGRALYDVVLSTDWGDTQLALCLDEACHQVDPLISKGVHCCVHVALTLVRLHYDDVNFDAVGRGYASKKFDNDILAIGSAAAHGVEVLPSKVSVASICLQYQALDP